ncbi:hypothetical protein [Methylobacterium longum]|uniref:Transcriptional regulator n=1 Tax=Methylobacterium longum TaxID=767694 RepID=A0ABT8AP03_9HYPH|nr:hypothetical protein [Methylobacterium longum]MDN3571548.1 hypothetical protein [Methylobacterium longum]GJE12472.1 hypothetical protein FOHLNKBM_3521 [Methylobacterium longum]
MPTEPHAPIRGRAVKALRAVAANPGGLRMQAHPSAMPMLVEMGLVESRQARGPGRTRSAWFLTRAGRELLAEVGANEVRAD